jgi:hypothetical protein
MFRGRSLRASVTDEEYNERATAFEKVFSHLRQCSKLLDVSPADRDDILIRLIIICLLEQPSNSWILKEADFFAAVELDETHMQEQERFHLG